MRHLSPIFQQMLWEIRYRDGPAVARRAEARALGDLAATGSSPDLLEKLEKIATETEFELGPLLKSADREPIMQGRGF